MPISISFLRKNKTGRLDLLALVLFSAFAIIQIGNFGIRLANPPSGDDPVIYAHFLSNPESFKGDQIYFYGAIQGYATITNWLPALLYRTLGLAPEIPAWIILFLQNMLLGVGLLKFARTVTHREDVAWLTAFFGYAAQPMQWNLVSLTNLMTIPYTTPLATPFYLFASAAAIEMNLFWTAAWLFLGGLIQPSMTLIVASMIGLFWVIRMGWAKWRETLKRLLSLGPTFAVCLIPALAFSGDKTNQVSAPEFMALLPLNGHLSPWVFPPTWSVMLPSFVGFSFLAILAIRERKYLTYGHYAFWLAAAATFVIAAVLYVVGWIEQSPLLLQLGPLRFSIYLVMFSLPMMMAYLVRKMAHQFWVVRWAAIAITLLYVFLGYGCFLALGLVLLLGNLAAGQTAISSHALAFKAQRVRWLMLFLAVAWVGLTAKSLSEGAYPWDTKQLYLFSWRDFIAGVPLGTLSTMVLWILLGALALAILHSDKVAKWLSRLRRTSDSTVSTKGDSNPEFGIITSGSTATILLICLSMLLTFQRAWQTGEQTHAPLAVAMYDAQQWAKQNTSQEAAFIYGGAWRTGALRKQIIPFPRFNYMYSGSRLSKNLDDDISEFYGLTPYQPGEPVWDHINRQMAAYDQLDGKGICRFATLFGGDYVVRTSGQPPLQLPLVYDSGLVQIYRIDPGPASWR